MMAFTAIVRSLDKRPLLGGGFKAASSPFKTRREAEDWAAAAVEHNTPYAKFGGRTPKELKVEIYER
jgi:hypothetical protein